MRATADLSVNAFRAGILDRVLEIMHGRAESEFGFSVFVEWTVPLSICFEVRGMLRA